MPKLILYDFRCDTHGKFEDMVKSSELTTPCPECGLAAKRLVSTPRFDPKMGLDPGFPSAYDAWAKRKTIRAKTDRAHYKEHGTDATYGGDVKS